MSSPGTSLDFVQIVKNVASLAGTDGILWITISAFCYFMALVMVLVAANQFRDMAETGRTATRAPILTLIAAALLAAVPEAITTVAATLYGSEMRSPLSSVKDVGGGGFKAVLTVVSLMGYMYFVRGIFVLKQSGEPQRHPKASVSSAAIIMISGMCAIYIDTTIRFIAGTAGWDVSQYIS